MASFSAGNMRCLANGGNDSHDGSIIARVHRHERREPDCDPFGKDKPATPSRTSLVCFVRQSNGGGGYRTLKMYLYVSQSLSATFSALRHDNTPRGTPWAHCSTASARQREPQDSNSSALSR